MENKVKIVLNVITKVYNKFAETQSFVDKEFSEECYKEAISVDKLFQLCFIINNSC